MTTVWPGQMVRKPVAGKSVIKVPSTPKTDAQLRKAAENDRGGYVNPSAEELAEMVAILTDDSFDYENPTAMARDVLATAFRMVRDREWFTVYRGGQDFEGLEITEDRIRKWADKRLHPNEFRLYARISGPGLIEARRLEVEADIEADEARIAWKTGGLCPECKHPGSVHTVFLGGRVKPGAEPSPGKCTGPGRVFGPEVDPNVRTPGLKMCGCTYAIKRQVAA